MKKLFFLFLLLFGIGVSIHAQDVIVKKDGSTVLCRIYEVNGTDIVYKKWSDLNGDKYIMDRSIVSVINYQDGRQDKLNEQTINSYSPGIQQTGNAQYNDNALLALDNARTIGSDWYKNYKRNKTIAWGAGGGCLGAGLVLIITGCMFEEEIGIPLISSGTVLAAGGIVTGAIFFSKANKIKKQAQLLTSSPIYQHEFNINNSYSIMAGVNLIQNHQTHKMHPGLGLQFNF